MYLFLERGEVREKERKRNINVWLCLACPPLGTWPATQPCALTGNWTSDPLVHRLTFNLAGAKWALFKLALLFKLHCFTTEKFKGKLNQILWFAMFIIPEDTIFSLPCFPVYSKFSLMSICYFYIKNTSIYF